MKISFFRNAERLKLVEGMSEVLLIFYKQYSDEHKKFAKFYPNYIMWLDAVIYRVDTILYEDPFQIVISKETYDEKNDDLDYIDVAFAVEETDEFDEEDWDE